MVTRILTTDPERPDDEVAAEAGRILREGGVVAIPTETVYGVAADAFNPRAVERLRNAKGRPEEKPLPVMVASAEDISEYAHRVPDSAWLLAEKYWPGPLTLVLYAGDRVGDSIHSGTERIGLRCPDHPAALAVLRAARRPLALTSANLSGEPETRTAQEVVAALEGRVDLVVDAGPCRFGSPSTVVDMTQFPPRVLREGTVSAQDISDTVGGVS